MEEYGINSIIENLSLPSDIITSQSPILDYPLPNYKCEIEASNSMSGTRYREFITGRNCARNALKKLGIMPQGIPILSNRSPSWPNNIVGSISHTKQQCLVIVALKSNYISLGVDIERTGSVTPRIEKHLLSLKEINNIKKDTIDGRTLFFSAKESVFKCLNPTNNIFFDFLDVEIEINQSNKFIAKSTHSCPFHFSLKGWYAISSEFVVTVCQIPK